jgi:enoyl-CoA hydratase/carnithine racemase
MRTDTYLGDIRDLEADLVVAAFFEDERPPGGLAGLLDWYLCGLLTDLLFDGRATGAQGEMVLLATQGKLKIGSILAVGLGSRADADPERLTATLPAVAERIAELKAETVAVGFLGSRGVRFTPARRIKLILRDLAGKDGPERLVILPEGDTEVRAAEKALRARSR